MLFRSSGKTMVSLSTIAEVQKNGGVAAFIDAEHALTPKWCRSLGVDFDNLLLTQPDSGETALSIMKYLIETGTVDVIVLDSVAALVTKREIEGDMDANHMALTARLMSLALKKLTPIVSKSKTCCIFINQLRDNVGVMYGAKEITPGGKALKFYSSVRLKASKKYKGEKFEGTGDQKRQIGHTVQVKVVKNKVGAPFREAEFDLYYNSGIDWKSEIFKIGVERGVIDRPSKTKYAYGDLEWVGKDNAAEAITKDEELAKKIKSDIAEALLKDEPISTLIEKDGKIIDTETGEEEEIITQEDVDSEFDV